MRKLLVISMAILLSFTLASCGKSEEVKNVESAISTMGEVELTSNDEITDVEKLYDALPEEEKTDVENYETLQNARTEFDDMLKGFSDEVKFCARAMIAVQNNADISGFNIERIGYVMVDDINYSIIIVKDPAKNKNKLFIATNEGVLVLGKSWGVFDDETGFTTFENPDSVDSAFMDNYDLDNNIDPNEALAIAFRYVESRDAELLDISGFAKNEKVATKTDAENVSMVLLKYVELQEQYMDELANANFIELNEIYNDSIKIVEFIRKTDLSAISEELESSKAKLATSLAYFSYECMKLADAYEDGSVEGVKIHGQNVLEYQKDYKQSAMDYAKVYASIFNQ